MIHQNNYPGNWRISTQAIEHCAAGCNGDESVTAGDARSIFPGTLWMGNCIDPV